jgi:hypothetical protein
VRTYKSAMNGYEDGDFAYKSTEEETTCVRVKERSERKERVQPVVC